MGDTRDAVGKAGLVIAGGAFRVALYVCAAVLIFWIGKTTYHFGYDVFNQQAMNPGAGQEITVVISEGASDYAIARTLENKGLIRDARVFWAQEYLSDYNGKLKAGTYLLSTAYTPTRIMSVLAGEESEGGESEP